MITGLGIALNYREIGKTAAGEVSEQLSEEIKGASRSTDDQVLELLQKLRTRTFALGGFTLN